MTAERYPQTVEAILAAGHEVGRHSHTHVSAVDLSAAEQREDFERAPAVLIEAPASRGDVDFATCREVAEGALADPATERRVHDPEGIDLSAYPGGPGG